ncbi:MAG: hypothetical protein M5U01_18230 [Ardenticatenaceae bacterium]|nr:hypothetical protein [Ardenticatenaceae bacterium]HBY98469.1 hypothetical protein [Chloroflexota bacterium]
MADDAGFAVALAIRERLFNDALLVAYTGIGLLRTLQADLPQGPPDVSIDAFLAPPRIICKSDHTLNITLQVWGSLKVILNGVEQTGNVVARLTLRIQPSFSVLGSNLMLGFDDPNQNDVTVTEWDFTVLGGGFSPEAESYLRSSAFRARLQAVSRSTIAGLALLLLIDISFLGDGILSAVKGMVAQSRVVDGALLLGLDIDIDTVSGSIQTNGDVNRLTDFARANDIAAATNAVAVPVLLQQVESQVRDQVAENGATLERLKITAQAGRFHVEGRASNNTGTANFSFNVIPALTASRPGKSFHYLPKNVFVKPRVWPALGFTTADVHVDVDPHTWLAVVSVIAGVINPIIPIAVFDMASSAAKHLNADIRSANTGTPVPRVQRLKPSRPGGPIVRVEIADYEITTLGTYIGITVRPQAPPGMLIGPTSIPSDLRAGPLEYSVRPPLGVQPDDPALRIRWTVIDASGTVLLNEDDVAAGRETFTFSPAVVGPGRSQLGIGVRVYRTLGAQITDFLNDSITLQIRGPLAPGTYVRWFYDVKNPQVVFDEQDQEWAYAGESVVRRHSRWHRTDRPCSNASKRSRYRYETEVRDSLPFSVAKIALHRTELCDYCFYGGPGGLRPSL